MVQTNSSFDLAKVRHELEIDAREIQDITHEIGRKDVDLKRAQQVFDKAKAEVDKIDREIKELHIKKDTIAKKRLDLERNLAQMQRELTEMQKKGGGADKPRF
jgi:chromosome segregation ATPase